MNVANDMLRLETDMEKYGLAWSEHDAQARFLEDMTKSVLSQIELEHVGEPVNMREMRARADQRYLNHLEGLKEAKSLANQFRVKYDSTVIKIEIRRSLNAVKRAEMGLGR